MINALNAVIPIFGLMGIGFLFRRKGLLTQAGVAGVINFAFLVALPALIFRSMAGDQIARDFEPNLLFAYYGAGLVQYALTYVVARWRLGLKADQAGLFAGASMFSNLVLISIPLVSRVFGEAALAPLILIITLHSAIFLTLISLVVSLGQSGEGPKGQLLSTLRKTVLGNPVVVAAIAGLACGLLSIPIPFVIDESLRLAAQASSPLSLFAVGATMADVRLRRGLSAGLILSALKLLAFPALVYVACVWVFPVRPEWLPVVLVVASAPLGANISIMAQRFDTYVEETTSAFILSTLISLVTTTVLISLVT